MIEESIKITEKILLTLIGIATVFATCQEIYYLVLQQKVQLADLLLLFIYTEVLGMVAIFYKSRRIPILLPTFIYCNYCTEPDDNFAGKRLRSTKPFV